MVTTMPQSVKCCRCERRFRSGAVMQKDGRSIPALVVPKEVGSAQEAIQMATCQVCLNRTGDPARGLKRVLGELGVSELSTIPVGRNRRERVPDPRATAGRRHSFAPPSLADVTIIVPGARKERIPNRPVRIPKPLPPPHPQQRGGAPADRQASNREMLEAATHALAARQAAERQAELERRAREREERQRRFDRTVKVLRLMLLRTRERAPSQDIDERIVTIDRKLRLAAASDPKQRDKNALMELVGTSVEELVKLSRLVYLTMSVEPYEPNGFNAFAFTRFVPRKPGPHLLKMRRAERVMMDAFPGGRRPESWDSKGGTRPGFYELEVTRPQSPLPIPNPPLPDGGEDPHPRIVYPEGAGYGHDYTVEHSKLLAGVEDKIDRICESLPSEFLRWLARYREDLFITTEMIRLHDDLVELVEVFFLFQKRERDAQASAQTPAPAVEPTTTAIATPDLPATT